MGKKGLVISGGGAFGAYGVGTLAGLDKDYDVIAGVSTGALMGALVMLRKWDTLKNAYTSVNQKSIFDTKWYRPNVFRKNGNLNLLSVLYVIITRMFKKNVTLGTTKAMRKLIDKFITKEDFANIRAIKKDVIVAAVNVRQHPAAVHYFNIADCEFEDFKDWMWASANAPIVTTLLEKKWKDEQGNEHVGDWVDGGLTELFSLDKVVEMGCDEIDVIIHRTRPEYENDGSQTQDLLHLVERCLDAMRFDIEFSDGKLDKKLQELAAKGVKIRVFWLGRKLSTNSLIFDKDVMLQWYNEGFATANDAERIDIYQ